MVDPGWSCTMKSHCWQRHSVYERLPVKKKLVLDTDQKSNHTESSFQISPPPSHTHCDITVTHGYNNTEFHRCQWFIQNGGSCIESVGAWRQGNKKRQKANICQQSKCLWDRVTNCSIKPNDFTELLWAHGCVVFTQSSWHCRLVTPPDCSKDTEPRFNPRTKDNKGFGNGIYIYFLKSRVNANTQNSNHTHQEYGV